MQGAKFLGIDLASTGTSRHPAGALAAAHRLQSFKVDDAGTGDQ